MNFLLKKGKLTQNPVVVLRKKYLFAYTETRACIKLIGFSSAKRVDIQKIVL